jgi:hypothetical protein
MTPMTLDELRELAPAYVMGTLSDNEFAAFRAGLADPAISEALEAELSIHRAVAQSLASDFAVTPPPSLKARLEARLRDEREHDQQLADERKAVEERVARVAAERREAERAMAQRLEVAQMAELRAAETREFAAPTLPTDVPVSLPAVDVPPPSRPSAGTPTRALHVTPPRGAVLSRRKSTAPAWAIAGVFGLAMAASLFFAVSLRTRVQSLESELAGQARLAEVTAQRLAARDSLVNTLTRAENNLVVVRLASKDSTKRSMQLYWNQKTGEAIMHASGLAPNAANKMYCLWMIRNGKPEAITMFSPDDDGHRLINALELPRNAQGIAAFAVTEEPSSGSPLPTMTPFLLGTAPTAAEPR